MTELETLAKAWGTACENPLQKLILLAIANGIQNTDAMAAKACATPYETGGQLTRMAEIGLIVKDRGTWVIM